MLFPRRTFLLFALAGLIFLGIKLAKQNAPIALEDEREILLGELAPPPDWSQLDRFQGLITRETFIERLRSVYTKNDLWQKWVTFDPLTNSASIGDFTLRFSESDQDPPGAIFDWKSRKDLSPARPQVLTGLHIALDPGHIGGAYAEIEEREYEWEGTIIREGVMTLRTAEKLQPLLEELGAKVTLVRKDLNPVTTRKASDFSNPRLFYRTSEIRARAKLVNETIQPDLVICLHYNGTGSEKPENFQHFHILINGTYTGGELAREDERFQMLQRLLSGTITEELPLAEAIAESFNESVPMPPYRYNFLSTTSQNLLDNPKLWARNLLANRLYQCPVIYMEPYVMNSFPFLEAYQKDPEAIYQEYAEAVATGIARYYSR